MESTLKTKSCFNQNVHLNVHLNVHINVDVKVHTNVHKGIKSCLTSLSNILVYSSSKIK